MMHFQVLGTATGLTAMIITSARRFALTGPHATTGGLVAATGAKHLMPDMGSEFPLTDPTNALLHC